MNTLSASTSIIAHSLAWALLHSLWQGLLIYTMLYVLLASFPGFNARIKYYLSLVSLGAIVAWFVGTWVSQYQQLKGIVVFTSATSNPSIARNHIMAIGESSNMHHSAIDMILHQVEQYFPMILIFYTVGLAFMLFRFAVNIMQIRGLRTQGLMPLAQKYHDLLTSCSGRLGINRKVQLYLSNKISVPMMLGAIKPIILLPVATMNHLTIEQVEAILLHELAHIKRHDYLLNIFQTIAETLLFFNPFVWLSSSITRREREHCCDDLVVACSANPLPYAKALTLLEDIRLHHNSLAMAATGRNNHLFHRIKRIMEMKKNNVNNSQLAIIMVMVIAITTTIVLFTFTPSLAQKAKAGKSDTTSTSKSSYHYKTVTIDDKGNKKVIEKTSSKPMDDDDNNVDAHIFTSDNVGNETATNTKVYTKIIKDSSGRQKVITTTTTEDGTQEKVTSSNDMEGMNKDLERMGHDLKEMTKNLVNTNIDVYINWDEIKDQLNGGLAELDKELNDPNLKKEIKIEMKKQWDKTRDALDEAKKEIDEARKYHASASLSIHKKDANTGNSYEAMLAKMERDGLIDRSGKYSVRKEDGTLYINGTPQPDNIYNKYIDYLKDDGVSIKGNKGSLTISIND